MLDRPRARDVALIDGTLTVQIADRRRHARPGAERAPDLGARLDRRARAHAGGPRPRDAAAPRARRDPHAPARAREAARARDVLRRPRDHAAGRVRRDRGRVPDGRRALRAAGARALRSRRARGAGQADLGAGREGADRRSSTTPRAAATSTGCARTSPQLDDGVGRSTSAPAQARGRGVRARPARARRGRRAPRDGRLRDGVPPPPRPPRVRGEPRVGAVPRPGRRRQGPAQAAAAERRNVEEHLVGRRPWPRALVALALLCAAGGDADTARWHLRTALIIDPTLPAAVALAQRLGMRR